MKPTASVLAKVSVEMTGVTMDNRTAPVKVVRKADTTIWELVFVMPAMTG